MSLNRDETRLLVWKIPYDWDVMSAPPSIHIPVSFPPDEISWFEARGSSLRALATKYSGVTQAAALVTADGCHDGDLP